jgi:hypothetical protein
LVAGIPLPPGLLCLVTIRAKQLDIPSESLLEVEKLPLRSPHRMMLAPVRNLQVTLQTLLASTAAALITKQLEYLRTCRGVERSHLAHATEAKVAA